jgi:hypothetical protein
MRQDGVAHVRLEIDHPAEATASPAGAPVQNAAATETACPLSRTTES